ncbi:MAG: acetyl-CoA carboxylase biotin carboxyl carrier protein [Pseudomonadota bacterium]
MSDKKKESAELDPAFIREMAMILDENSLTEIEFENDDMKVRVARNISSSAVTTIAAPPPQAAAAPVPAPAPAPQQSAAPAEATPSDNMANHPGAVPSPMVGTAYLAPSPGADPFVKVGDSVSEGQTLMIVEAMKTMNPIAAPRSGKVSKIIAQDSQPVEFGEPLLILE